MKRTNNMFHMKMPRINSGKNISNYTNMYYITNKIALFALNVVHGEHKEAIFIFDV